MIRWTAWLLGCCVSCLAMADGLIPEPGLSAEQIIEKNVAARGGLDAWKKVQSMVWIGHIESAQAPIPSLPFVLVQKRPDKTRFEIKTQNQLSLRIYDGSQGWKLRPTGNGKPELQPYTAEELSFAHDGQGIDGPLVDYQAKGIAVALEGIDEVEGHKTYRLGVKQPSGSSHHVWVDAKTFLDVKSDRELRNVQGQPVRLAMYYRNYKLIDGLQIPHMLESGTDIAMASDKMVIDKIMLNQSLDERVFEKPKVQGQRKRVPVSMDTASSMRRPTSSPVGTR